MTFPRFMRKAGESRPEWDGRRVRKAWPTPRECPEGTTARHAIVVTYPHALQGISHTGHEPVFYCLFEAFQTRRISAVPGTGRQAQIPLISIVILDKVHAGPDVDAAGDVFPAYLVGTLSTLR